MDISISVILLVSLIASSAAYPPRLKVYEIRKSKSDVNFAADYFDPDAERKLQSSSYQNNVRELTSDLLQNLQTLLKKGSSDDNDNEFDDKTRSQALVIIAEKGLLNELLNKEQSPLKNLYNSVLRSQNSEDRTLPPRHRDVYDSAEY